jgi:hypothetical protein
MTFRAKPFPARTGIHHPFLNNKNFRTKPGNFLPIFPAM